MIVQTSSDGPTDVRAAERVLVELLALDREVSELEYVRRSDALERAGDAVRILGELGSTEGILARAAAELGLASQLEPILISEVCGAGLVPLARWDRDGEGAAAPDAIELAYPMIETEVVRGRGVAVVGDGDGRGRAFARLLATRSYVVAALTAQGETIGLLHAAVRDREPDPVDVEVVTNFSRGLSGVLERAVLRHTLALHRGELETALEWMSGRLTRLSLQAPSGARVGSEAGRRMIQALTPRELDVLRLMARGNTNLQIANALVVREGTVKYHVKNILRKLGATSRADAVARFVRAASGEAQR